MALIAIGGVLATAISLGPWPRLRPSVAVGAVAASGVLMGAGALVVQDGATTAEWVISLSALGLLMPVHSWLVFGRPGRRVDGVVAADPGAASKGRNR